MQCFPDKPYQLAKQLSRQLHYLNFHKMPLTSSYLIFSTTTKDVNDLIFQSFSKFSTIYILCPNFCSFHSLEQDSTKFMMAKGTSSAFTSFHQVLDLQSNSYMTSEFLVSLLQWISWWTLWVWGGRNGMERLKMCFPFSYKD